MWFININTPLVAFLFCLLFVSLAQKPFSLMQSHLPISAFVCLCFWCYMQKLIAQTNVNIFPVFSSRNFMVSSLIFQSLMYFELIFVNGVREGSSFVLLFSCFFSLFSHHHLLKRLSFL